MLHALTKSPSSTQCVDCSCGVIQYGWDYQYASWRTERYGAE